jgi:hypothetical protein
LDHRLTDVCLTDRLAGNGLFHWLSKHGIPPPAADRFDSSPLDQVLGFSSPIT